MLVIPASCPCGLVGKNIVLRVRSLGFGLSSLALDLDFEKRGLLASWSFSSLIFKLELIFPFFFFFFLLHCEAYGILVPRLGIKPWAFHNETTES